MLDAHNIAVDRRRDEGGATLATAPPAAQGTGLRSAPAAIRTPDQRVRVFVSSTLGELAPERAAAREAIGQLRLTPVLFEAGARSHPPRALYRAYLAQSDIFIGIYGQRYGQIAPGLDISGLEDEYRLASGKPKLIYIKTQAPDREPRLQALLDHIRDEGASSYRHFATPDELHDLIADDLAMLLTERFAGAAATPAPEPERPARLPALRGPFMDRDREFEATRVLLLSDDVGLLTLTGPGGVGKTRVAVQVAADLAPQFADGVAFIPLDTLTDPARLAATVAQYLGIPAADGRPLDEVLLAYLRPRQLLLVLDNVEHLISAAAPLVTAALEAAPRLKILATSREPLRVRNERVVPIPPLALPKPGPLPPLEELAHIGSIAFFVERARELQPSFALTEENAAAVAAICRRLDGLPLAIELAAARLATLTPQALLAHLGRRLPLLTRGPRDLPARQQTMRATIAWSYDLLDEGGKTLFRRLSVFAGGFTLEAVAAVCLRDDPVPTFSAGSDQGGDALEGMAALVDQSLVSPPMEGVAGEPRFAMLDTIREYAAEQLAANGEVAALRRRHAAYFLSLAEAAESHYLKTDRGQWIERLHSEDANIRAALTWSTSDDAQQAAGGATGSKRGERGAEPRLTGALTGALVWYWFYRGQLQEGRTWLEALLARGDPDDRSATRGTAEFGAGLLAWTQGDLAAADRWAGAAVATATARGDRSQLAYAQGLLGLVRMRQGDLQAARPLLEDSRVALHETGQRWLEAYDLYYLASVAAMGGDLAAAQRFAEECLAIFTRLGDPLGQAMGLSALGIVATARGDYPTATTRFAEGLPLIRAAGRPNFLAQFLGDAGRAWLGQGDEAQAQRLLAESLGLWCDIGRPDGAAIVLVGLAEIAARGQPRRAARLLGAAQALRTASGTGWAPYLQTAVERTTTGARAALGADAFDAALAEGAALSLEQAVTEARDESPPGGKGDGAHD